MKGSALVLLALGVVLIAIYAATPQDPGLVGMYSYTSSPPLDEQIPGLSVLALRVSHNNGTFTWYILTEQGEFITNYYHAYPPSNYVPEIPSQVRVHGIVSRRYDSNSDTYWTLEVTGLTAP